MWLRSYDAVVARNGEVAVQHGHGSLVGWRLASYQGTGVPLNGLTETSRREVQEIIKVPDSAAATKIVDRLRAEAAGCRSNLTGGCPVLPLRTPTLSARPADYPHGNQIVVSFRDVDTRKGVRTRLTIDGGTPPFDCPVEITHQSGSCRFTSSWGPGTK